jgi:hypothetical protein
MEKLGASNKFMTTETKEHKVFQLVQELEETMKQKKATAKAYRDDCKRIKDEITALIEGDDDSDEKDV